MFDSCRRAIARNSRLAHSIVFGAIATFAWAGQAPAQQPAGASGETPEVIESIVITARRREENLQDTPVAVTALSADAL